MFTGRILFVLLFLYNLCSCTFSPDHKYINPVHRPPDSIHVLVNIHDPNFKDPYELFVPSTFYFTIDSLADRIASFTVTLDGSTILTGAGNQPIQFAIDPTNLTNGSHSVSIKIQIDTESGSLADYLKLEYYTVSRDFTILTDNVPPGPIPTPTLMIENGYLTFRWTNFNKNNFEIHVQRSLANSNTSIPDTVLVSSATEFVDKGYVGGNGAYSLLLVGSGFAVHAGTASFNLDPIHPILSEDANHIIHIAWDNPVIVGDNPSILFQRVSGTNMYPMTANNILGDTLVLGGSVYEWIIVKSPNYPAQQDLQILPFSNSPNLTSFTNLVVLTVQNKFITVATDPNTQKAYRYSFSTFAKEDSIGASQFVASQNGQIGVTYNGNFLNINPVNFSQSSPLSLSPLQLTSLTNTNQLSLYSYNESEVVDLNSVQTTYQIQAEGDPITLSDDGKYLFTSYGLVLANSNGQWSTLGNIPGFQYTSFRNKGTSELVVINGALQVMVYDLSLATGSGDIPISRTFTLPNVSAYQFISTPAFDAPSQNVYLETLDMNTRISTIQLYDISTFSRKGKAVAFVPNSAGNRHLYTNGYHFITSGYVEQVQ